MSVSRLDANPLDDSLLATLGEALDLAILLIGAGFDSLVIMKMAKKMIEINTKDIINLVIDIFGISLFKLIPNLYNTAVYE